MLAACSSILAIGSVLVAVAIGTPRSGPAEIPVSQLSVVAYSVAALCLASAALARSLEPRADGLKHALPAVMCAIGWGALPLLVWPESAPAVRLFAAGACALIPGALLHVVQSPAASVRLRWPRAAVPLAYAIPVGLSLAHSLTTDPFLDPRCRTLCDVDALLLLPSPATSLILGVAFAASSAIIAAAATATAITCLVRSPRRSASMRGLLVSVAAAALLEALWHLSPDARVLLGPDPADSEILFVLRCAAFTAIGAAILWDAVQRARALAAMHLAIRALVRDDGDQGMRSALATGLDDPGVRVSYWLPTLLRWSSESGESVPSPGSSGSTAVISRVGETIAMVEFGRTDLDASALDSVVGAAARVAIDNERMRAESRAQLLEVRASRRRIVEASDQARREVERDLHDGAQQRLLAASYSVRLAIEQATARADRPATSRLSSILVDLLTALDTVREIARRTYPPVLLDAGVGPALESLARTMPARLALDAAGLPRLPSALELSAYLAVRTALAATSGQVTAEVRCEEDVMTIDISGVAPYPKTEIEDRVRALGGRVVLTPAGVHVEVPCG
jgi:signal transduction histidine kinase